MIANRHRLAIAALLVAGVFVANSVVAQQQRGQRGDGPGPRGFGEPRPFPGPPRGFPGGPPSDPLSLLGQANTVLAEGPSGAARARELATAARVGFKDFGDYHSEALAVRTVAFTYMGEGDFKTAEAAARESVAIAEAAKSNSIRAITMATLALTIARQRRFEDAFTVADEAYRIARIGPALSIDLAYAAYALGSIHNQIGQTRAAEVTLKDALKAAKDAPVRARPLVSQISIELATIAAAQGDMAAVLAYLKNVEPSNTPSAVLAVGELYMKIGQAALAEPHAKHVLELIPTSRGGVANRALAMLGDISLIRGREKEAKERFQRISESRAPAASLGFIGLARISEKAGDFARASELYERAIELQQNFLDSNSNDEWRQSLFQKRIEPFEGAVRTLVQQSIQASEDGAIARRAFDANERIYNRIFTEHLLNAWARNHESPKILGGNLEAIDERLTSISKTLTGSDVGSGRRQALTQELDRLEVERSSLRREMTSYADRAAHEKRLDNLSVPQIQQLLPPGAALLEYTYPDFSAILVVTRDMFRVVKVSTSESLPVRVTLYNEILANGRPGRLSPFEQRASRGIYQDVVEPALKILPSSISQLIIVPTGALEKLPFEALVSKEDGRFLIEDFAVSYVPAASVLAVIPQQPAEGRRLLAVADPVFPGTAAPSVMRAFVEGEDFDLRQLPYTRMEAESLADIYGREFTNVVAGIGASERQIKAMDLSPYRVLHFATHSVISPPNPDRSALVLSMNAEAEEDGFLQVREIYDLKLKADLVVLSSCQTAAGSGVLGDGLQGFARAFFFAGARSLVASLWKVEDEATSTLMSAFYGYLRDGYSKSESLRRAKIDFIKNGANPRQWAAFTLMGESQGLVPMHSRSTKWIVWALWAGGAALVLSVTAFFLRKRYGTIE